jgi:uncharacterized protein YciI
MARRPVDPGSTPQAAAKPAKPPATPRPAASDSAPVARPVPSGKLFSVTRSRGPAWNPALPQEGQADWTGHAAFMNGLERDGFVIVGGPLEDTPYTMLAIRAADAPAVRDRLAQDPWETMGVLETTRIVGWNLALGQGKI